MTRTGNTKEISVTLSVITELKSNGENCVPCEPGKVPFAARDDAASSRYPMVAGVASKAEAVGKEENSTSSAAYWRIVVLSFVPSHCAHVLQKAATIDT